MRRAEAELDDMVAGRQLHRPQHVIGPEIGSLLPVDIGRPPVRIINLGKYGHPFRRIEFYMDEVKNMNYKDATRKVYSEWCGDKQAKIEVVKDASINKFYLLYHRATNNEKVKH